MPHARVRFFVLLAALILSSAPANAQPLGTFRWQLLPFCNVLARGIAFLNPDGSVGFGITTVMPGGTAVRVDATISMASLGGSWRDSAGNTGTFAYFVAGF